MEVQVNTDECWLWARDIDQHGYGLYHPMINGKQRHRRAHRLMYENFKGEIPEGLTIDHLCRVKRCVNPDHLEAVTMAENIARREKFRIFASHCKWGHEYTEENTIVRLVPRWNRVCRMCQSIASKRSSLKRQMAKIAPPNSRKRDYRL